MTLDKPISGSYGEPVIERLYTPLVMNPTGRSCGTNL